MLSLQWRASIFKVANVIYGTFRIALVKYMAARGNRRRLLKESAQTNEQTHHARHLTDSLSVSPDIVHTSPFLKQQELFAE